jgi:hypothetical protein
LTTLKLNPPPGVAQFCLAKPVFTSSRGTNLVSQEACNFG